MIDSKDYTILRQICMFSNEIKLIFRGMIMRKILYIFKTNGGLGPELYIEASNDTEAYEKARETLESLNMPFELELLGRYLKK